MPESDDPTSISHFLTRRVPHTCSDSSYVHFRQDLLRKHVHQAAEAHEDGYRLLYEGALAQLADADADLIGCALAVLFVIGTARDAAVVEPLLSHQAEHVRKAARTCLFEIRRRAD